MNPEDTIAAVSSPAGSGRRGIVRLTGPEAIGIADHLFTPADGSSLDARTGNRYVEGRVRVCDAELPGAAYLFRKPRSYTRDDVVELHLLGGPGVLALLLEACMAAGARRAEPGEFTARAYLAGAFDLPQVHAIAGMIAARSDDQLRAARRLMEGALGQTAKGAKQELAELLALVEASLDFADEPIEFISPAELGRRLDAVAAALRATVVAGVRVERWERLPRAVLVGAPNTGKSSLLNRLTGLDRAICAPVAGTTRDILSAPLRVGEVECLLVDVAGVTAPTTDLDARVQAAVQRAIAEADVLLWVVDALVPSPVRQFRDSPSEPGRPRPGSAAHRETLQLETAPVPAEMERAISADVPVIAVVNKCDLASPEQLAAARRSSRSSGGSDAQYICLTSALTGAGCEELKAAIERALHGRRVDVHDAAIALMAEHHEELETAIAALGRASGLAGSCGEHLACAELLAAELRAAAQALGALVGEEQTEEMLERIFSRFCIGK